jgi:hypothetical protein
MMFIETILLISVVGGVVWLIARQRMEAIVQSDSQIIGEERLLKAQLGFENDGGSSICLVTEPRTGVPHPKCPR